ncbi:unnamed protein product [Prorocentrum cordatum]|uniref:3-hydroxyisobutyryl-CoA hydrolase n=1 Tax=Prorocentrum cordatum TaxID=2364126 RepID=A0ABN9PGW9_9DINO|nr:unnamed protein product [Polarella glacialis]
MAEPEVLLRPEDGSRVASITLNRASKLNALNLNMIRLLHRAVDEVDRRAGRFGCIVLDGAGGRAFCAGGDVADVRAEGMAGGSLPADFFMEEYALVHRLASMPERTGCCQVSIWDGIVMGGGVGISAHGAIRIATERTLFAMPEMAIGFFPDVGLTFKLSRLPLGLCVGLYIGMTGARLGPWDCMRAGLATHFVPSASIPSLRKLLGSRLSGVGGGAAEQEAACMACASEAGAGEMPPRPTNAVLTKENVAVIDRCFAAPTLEGIFAALRAETGQFAAATLQSMVAACSPTSCKVTLRAMHAFAAEGVGLGHALSMEYRLALRFSTRPQPMSDFFEGVRAVVVDKDRRQSWRPGWSQLAEVVRR